MSFDVATIRKDFPILKTKMRERPLAYLDTAASAQKPKVVIDAISDFYANHYANIHRGVYHLSAEATRRYDEVRTRVANFIGGRDPREIVFVRNATEAINLVARSWGDVQIGKGDEIVVTAMEHHANIVPWQMLATRKEARLRVAEIHDDGNLDVTQLESLLGPRTRLLAFAHVSNVLGTVLPIAEMAERAHAVGALLLVDGAQAAPHVNLDVRTLGCDFYAFSGHKVYGPSGIGVLWARREVLAAMPPWQTGGGIVTRVTFEESEYVDPPSRFEPGTLNLEGVVGLGAALEFLGEIGRENVANWESSLVEYALDRLEMIPHLRLLGAPKERASAISFVLEGVHSHDVGTVLDTQGVAVRVGHLCAQPLMAGLGIATAVRVSFACYNTVAEIDALASGLRKAREIFLR